MEDAEPRQDVLQLYFDPARSPMQQRVCPEQGWEVVMLRLLNGFLFAGTGDQRLCVVEECLVLDEQACDVYVKHHLSVDAVCRILRGIPGVERVIVKPLQTFGRSVGVGRLGSCG